MKRSAIAIAGCLAVFASSAWAYDFSAKGRLTETVDGSDNYFLSNSSPGATFKSLSSLYLDFLAQTPTTQYLINGGTSYFKYFGPGASTVTPDWGHPANASFAMNHTTQLTRYNFVGSWSRVDTQSTSIAQTGFATGTGTTDTYSVGGGFVHDLGRIDTISWQNSANTASSSTANFTPYKSVNSALVWNHTLTPLTSINTLVSFDYFNQDNPQNTQRLLWRFVTGFQSRLTRRLSVNGHVGLVFANTYQNGLAGQPATSVTPVVDSTGVLIPTVGAFTPLALGAGHGPTWDVGLNYDLLKTTSISLNAAQSVIPTFTGQLQKSETVGFSLFHQINQVSNLSLFAQFAKTTSGTAVFNTVTTSNSDFWTASIRYNYRLTRDLNAAMSYSFNLREDNTGTAKANIVMVSLSYDFNLFGNPTPLNIAERERARQRAQQTVGYVFPNFR